MPRWRSPARTVGCNVYAVLTSHPTTLTVGFRKGGLNLDGAFNAADIQDIVNVLLAGCQTWS